MIILILFIYATIPIASTLQTARTQCPEGWRSQNQTDTYLRCFFVANKGGTFDQTVQFCQSLNANLASVHSKDEEAFLISLFSVDRRTGHWLGGRQSASTNYSWQDNSPFDYTNFVGEDDGCAANNECCVCLNIFGWHPCRCSRILIQICQKRVATDLPVTSKILDKTIRELRTHIDQSLVKSLDDNVSKLRQEIRRLTSDVTKNKLYAKRLKNDSTIIEQSLAEMLVQLQSTRGDSQSNVHQLHFVWFISVAALVGVVVAVLALYFVYRKFKRFNKNWTNLVGRNTLRYANVAQ